MSRRCGVTLLDQLLAIALMGILFSIASYSAGALRDRLAVRAAARAVKDAIALAREHAGASGARAAVRFDNLSGTVVVHAGEDSLHRLSLADAHGVSLSASRDSLAYMPSGLGYGAANLSIEIARGSRFDTISVSRLGRVR